jgi:beta-aspartyl-peptidase (threonine type)
MTAAQADGLRAALRAGYHLLDRGASSLTAVEETIRVLEGSGLFNAGRGAHLQLDGVRRMDASLMEGMDLRAGAVASIEGIVHPITAARLVMDETNHVLLAGPPATAFARHFKLARQPRRPAGHPKRRISMASLLQRRTLRLYRAMTGGGLAMREKHGRETVGAVALDCAGTLAAGASTGGVELMLPGRVGDTPLIGSGVYADNEGGAVSMTGLGEGIMRLAVAKAICERLAQGGSPAAAARHVLRALVARVEGRAGALVLTPAGRFAIAHVTPRMAAGWWNGRGDPAVRGHWR